MERQLGSIQSIDALSRSARMPPILCRGVNVAEHVAAMFDALVGSLDWGSGFLDAETIESILIVAELAGFDVPSVDVELDIAPLERPNAPPGGPNSPEWLAYCRDCKARIDAHRRAKTAAIAAWRAQAQAKARAMIAEADGSP